jgi:type II secretory pathway component PulF
MASHWMSRWPTGSRAQEAAIISAGVMDGRLSEALRRAMAVVQGIDEMKSSVFSTLGYPLVLISTVIGIMVLVSKHFIPQLAKIIPRETWEGGIGWLGVTSDFVVLNGNAAVSDGSSTGCLDNLVTQ